MPPETVTLQSPIVAIVQAASALAQSAHETSAIEPAVELTSVLTPAVSLASRIDLEDAPE